MKAEAEENASVVLIQKKRMKLGLRLFEAVNERLGSREEILSQRGGNARWFPGDQKIKRS